MEKIFAVDVETTGTNPQKHALLSVGVVSIDNPTKTFYEECQIWDGAEIELGALKVNGFTGFDAIDPAKQKEKELIQKLKEWLPQSNDLIILAHNAAFDRDFINAAFVRAGEQNPFSFRTIDVHSIVYMHLLSNKKDVPSRLSLNNCLKALGFPPEPNPHNALTGAKCNVDIFYSILNYDSSGQERLV